MTLDSLRNTRVSYLENLVKRENQKRRSSFGITGVIFVSVIMLALMFLYLGYVHTQKIVKVQAAITVVTSIISTISIVGVFASLDAQRRQLRLQTEIGMRSSHLELQQLALEDPELMAVWGEFTEDRDPATRRQHIYLNLIVSQWQMGYFIGAIHEVQLYMMARALFSSELAQHYWMLAQEGRLAYSTDKRSRHFNRIINRAFRESLAQESQK